MESTVKCISENTHVNESSDWEAKQNEENTIQSQEQGSQMEDKVNDHKENREHCP